MAKYTAIQWCFSTVNPVMGCDGCELAPASLMAAVRHPKATAVFAEHGHFTTSPSSLKVLARELVGTEEGQRVLLALQKCYACALHRNRGGKNKGYAKDFFVPEEFTGRTALASRWSDYPKQHELSAKPWLSHMPRMIFVSDMGDALSASVDFAFLKREIIDVAMSSRGVNKIWLWLTKRPARMAEFARWLKDEHGVDWPKNLWAGTSVTDSRSARRVEALLKVPATKRFVSYEPAWEYVDLKSYLGDDKVSWVIVGGESGGKRRHCADFRLSDLKKIIADAQATDTDLFVKQLGASPVDLADRPVRLKDDHGGDWDEWPLWCRIRKVRSNLASTASVFQPSIPPRESIRVM